MTTPEHAELVERLLGQLGLEDKIRIVSGRHAFEHEGAAALPTEPPIPPFSLADGPAGVRVNHPGNPEKRATALPAPIALAATWDVDAARRYGDLVGAEMAATGHNIMLGPAVDIARVPVGGRLFESFGEDPLLQARMAVAEIRAIQAHGVAACVKHYLANNQESQRASIDVQVDARTLREIYLRPAAAAIQQGGAAAVMGSYNRVNGSYACESRQLLTDILRGELGFQGFVMSDYLANRSTVASAEAGLDWELGERMWGERLLAAVRSGELALGVVDEMVRRILRPAVALGMVDRPVAFGAIPVERHGAAARELAEQGAVLLKNDGPLLPLDAQAIRSLAVIGVDAASVAAAGGGSSLVRPTYAVSVVDGLRQALPHAAVAHAPGCDPLGPGALLPGLPAVPSGALAPEGGEGRGLSAAYWPNPSFAGEPSLARREPRAELVRGLFDIPGFSAASQGAASLPMDMPAPFSARWRGTLRAHVAGEYTFSLTCLGSGRLTVGGATLIELPSQAGGEADPAFGGASAAARVASASIALAQGEHPLLVEYVADAPGFWPLRDAALRLGWQPPAELATPAIREAAELARSADVAVVVARTFESEEMDRPNLDLPNDQAQLIRAVVAANPRTVVVLMSGGPVEMASWADHTPAILQAWYAGQEQGAAVARLLLGDAAPAGRLPISFPRSMTESPVAAPEQYPGVGGAVHYREGLGVGYRGYDAQGIEPRYPFGYGLTYTSFAYRDLELATDAEGVIQVRFTLANTGQRAGTEVAQVYLGLPEDAAAPPRQLAGWARVALAPGEQRRVAVAIDPRAPDGPLRTWDAQASAWRVVAGACRVYVGQHARHTALAGTLDLSYNGGDPISEETSRQ